MIFDDNYIVQEITLERLKGNDGRAEIWETLRFHKAIFIKRYKNPHILFLKYGEEFYFKWYCRKHFSLMYASDNKFWRPLMRIIGTNRTDISNEFDDIFSKLVQSQGTSLMTQTPREDVDKGLYRGYDFVNFNPPHTYLNILTQIDDLHK